MRRGSAQLLKPFRTTCFPCCPPHFCRSQLPPATALALMPQLINLLRAEAYVVRGAGLRFHPRAAAQHTARRRLARQRLASWQRQIDSHAFCAATAMERFLVSKASCCWLTPFTHSHMRPHVHYK